MSTLRIPKPMSSASMVLCVLAEHVAPFGETIYRTELMALMDLLDMNVGTAGSAATRLAELGWLMRRRTGRYTHYTLTPAAKMQMTAGYILPPPKKDPISDDEKAERNQELTWFLKRYRSEQTAMRNQIHKGHGSPMSAESCFVRSFWLTYEFRLLKQQAVDSLFPERWSTEAVEELHRSYNYLLDQQMGDFVARRVFTMTAVL